MNRLTLLAFGLVTIAPVVVSAQEAAPSQSYTGMLANAGSSSKNMVKATLDQRQEFIKEMEAKQKAYVQGLLGGTSKAAAEASEAADSAASKLEGGSSNNTSSGTTPSSIFSNHSQYGNSGSSSMFTNNQPMFRSSNSYNVPYGNNGNFNNYGGVKPAGTQ